MSEPVYPTVDQAELEPEYSEHHRRLLNGSVPLLDIAYQLALRDREILELRDYLGQISDLLDEEEREPEETVEAIRNELNRLESERDAALARARDADAVRDSLNAMVRQLDDATEPDTFDAEAIERVLGTAAWNDQLTVVKADTVRAWLGKITALESRIRELTESNARLLAELGNASARIHELQEGNDTACESPPVGCDCPGCSLARELSRA